MVYAQDSDLTYDSIRFDISLSLKIFKSLNIFWPQIKENVPKNTMYLVMILAVKRKLCAIFLVSRGSSWSIANTGKLLIFRDNLLSKLIFVNENSCLCTCFTELYLFYWLSVVSFVILIAAPVVFSRTYNKTSHAGVLKMLRVSYT